MIPVQWCTTQGKIAIAPKKEYSRYPRMIRDFLAYIKIFSQARLPYQFLITNGHPPVLSFLNLSFVISISFSPFPANTDGPVVLIWKPSG